MANVLCWIPMLEALKIVGKKSAYVIMVSDVRILSELKIFYVLLF